MALESLYPLIILTCVGMVHADIFNVNMENTAVCTMSQAVLVRSQDVYNIFAEPPQDGKGTRDRCTVKFTGQNGQRFKLYVRDLQFGECLIYVKMYDGDMFLNQARYNFDCNSGAGGYFESYSSQVAISLEKPDSASTSYKFYLRLALVNGPEIGGETGNPTTTPSGMSTGVLVAIIVASVIVVAVLVAIMVYCFIVYRRKKEEKEAAMFHGTSHTNLTNTITTAHSMKDGSDSVHSSKHSTHSTHSTHVTARSNPVFQYPAHRSTIMSIRGKGECNSIDTQSYDNDSDTTKVKSVKHEFDSMKRTLKDIEMKKKRQAEADRRYENGREEARRYDQSSRNETQQGLGRSERRRNEPTLNAENIRASLRAARDKGRSFDDRDGRGQRSRTGSTRSHRSKHNSRSVESASDHHSDRYNHHDNRSRSRSRDNSGRNRSASAGSMSRRSRPKYYDERDAFSEEDFDRRDRRRHRDRADSSGQRSRGHRARSSSTDSRRRAR